MANAINLQELEQELTNTKAQFQQWSSTVLSAAQGCKVSHLAKMKASKGEPSQAYRSFHIGSFYCCCLHTAHMPLVAFCQLKSSLLAASAQRCMQEKYQLYQSVLRKLNNRLCKFDSVSINLPPFHSTAAVLCPLKHSGTMLTEILSFINCK